MEGTPEREKYRRKIIPPNADRVLSAIAEQVAKIFMQNKIEEISLRAPTPIPARVIAIKKDALFTRLLTNMRSAVKATIDKPPTETVLETEANSMLEINITNDISLFLKKLEKRWLNMQAAIVDSIYRAIKRTLDHLPKVAQVSIGREIQLARKRKRTR